MGMPQNEVSFDPKSTLIFRVFCIWKKNQQSIIKVWEISGKNIIVPVHVDFKIK